MIIGPVGRRDWVTLRTAPQTPATAPNSAASAIMTPRRSVHCRAATAGPISIATISTTPTVCRPITTAMTISEVSSTLKRSVAKPRLAAKSASNARSLNSL